MVNRILGKWSHRPRLLDARKLKLIAARLAREIAGARQAGDRLAAWRLQVKLDRVRRQLARAQGRSPVELGARAHKSTFTQWAATLIVAPGTVRSDLIWSILTAPPWVDFRARRDLYDWLHTHDASPATLKAAYKMWGQYRDGVQVPRAIVKPV